MILEGDISVIDAIKEKKHLMDAGEAHGHIRPLLIMGGGLMKGVYGVGAAVAMEELGFARVFTNAVGISVGGPIIAYLLCENTHEGSVAFCEDVASRKFFNLWRMPTPCDTDFMDAVLQGSTGKPIYANKVLASPTHFYTAAARFVEATPVLLRPDTEQEVFLALKASYSMPGVVKEPVEYQNELYVDGASTKPHSIKKIIESVSATHILFVTNQDEGFHKVAWIERFLNATIFRHRMSSALRAAAGRRGQEREQTLKDLHSSNMQLAVVWGDKSITSLTRGGKKAAKVIEKSRLWWRGLLAK